MGDVEPQDSPGIQYPRSGEVVAHAADFLRLKGYLKDHWAGGSYKTAQRYFKGEPVNDVRGILLTLVESLIPPNALVPAPIASSPTRLCDWIADAIEQVLGQWDAFAGTMNGGITFPLIERRLAPVPFLRLAILDLGMRLAAYKVLAGTEPTSASPWFASECFGLVVDELRGRLSVEALAEKTGVSGNALAAWRTGASTPTDAHLRDLATALEADDSAAFRLRIAAGVTGLRKHVVQICGQDRIDDLVLGLVTTVRLAHRALTFAPFAPDVRENALRELVHLGARASAGARLATLLAESSPLNQEVQADFLALPGPWVARLTYWAKAIASLVHAPVVLPRHMNITAERAAHLAPFIEAMVFKMGDFDRFPEGMATAVIKGDPFTSAMNRVIQADRAASVGDLPTAVVHSRRAVRLQPQNAKLHFALGAQLGQLMAHGDRSYLKEALDECLIASQLAPEWDVPQTEIGVILSNAGQSDEAEAAFQRAEPLARGKTHFHQVRGVNFLWLGRFEDAEASFRAGLDLASESLELRVRLAAALAHLGQARAKEVKRLAAEIRHRGGPIVDDFDGWKRFVPTQPWRRAPRD